MKTYHWGWICFSFLLVVAPTGSSQVRRMGTQHVTPAKPLAALQSTSKDTKYVSCWDKKQSLTGSHLVRSPILTSSDGRHRAYVEVEATAYEPQDKHAYSGPLCANTSRLYVAGPEDKTFRLVYLQSPTRWELGNSLKLVDWAPGGTQLLVELTTWQYESEGDFTEFILFSPDFGVITKADLPGILSGRFGKDCGSENSAIGFTLEENVVLAVSPLEDSYENEGATSCVKQKTLLALDMEHGLKDTAKVLPSSFSVRHYGHFPEPQASR